MSGKVDAALEGAVIPGRLDHVGITTPSIERSVEAYRILRGAGATVLGSPRIGAHGSPVVFVHPRDTGGVLVELLEAPGEAR